MKRLAFTFDDGPNDPDTLDLLEVLSKHGVKATFFMIGTYVRQRPDIVRQVAAEGHTIGNHTYSHPSLETVSLDEAIREIEDCERALTEVVGIRSGCFRAPYLRYTSEVIEYARARDYKVIGASSVGGDWLSDYRVDDIVARVLRRQTGQSGVVSLHDGSELGFGADRSHTVRATEHLIVRFKDEGFEFVSDPSAIPLTSDVSTLWSMVDTRTET